MAINSACHALFEVDFTELENYRKANQAEFVEQGTKLTPVLFFVKALIPVLRAHPILPLHYLKMESLCG